MKSKTKLFLKTFIISAWCCTLFVGIGYYYLNKSVTEADKKENNIPYSQQIDESAGILFEINDEKLFLDLDFYNKKIVVSLTPEQSVNSQIYGYSHNFTVQCEGHVLANIIDYLNGIELEIENKKYRYTGLQVVELIETNKLKDKKRVILEAVFNKISVQGVGTDFFADIINNSITDLKLSDCYFWADEMSTLANNIEFID